MVDIKDVILFLSFLLCAINSIALIKFYIKLQSALSATHQIVMPNGNPTFEEMPEHMEDLMTTDGDLDSIQ